MRCVLALDQGGSKCEAALFRDSGELLGWGRVQEVGFSGRSPEITIKAARQALGCVPLDELHVVNLHQNSSPIKINELGIPHSCRVSVHQGSEHTGAMALTDEDCGIVIVAGTGARLFGKNRDGRQVCLDGVGPVLGDVGSGYQIGYLGLRASVRGLWHERHATSLTGKIFNACCKISDEGKTVQDKNGAREPANMAMDKSMAKSFYESNINPFGRQLNEMVKFSLRNNDRSVIASLAVIVNDEAHAGDAVAIGILQNAAFQMAENVRDLADHLRIGSDSYVMIGTGSVAMKSDIYWKHLCKLVKVFAPGLEPLRSPLPPVAGLALLQLMRLEGNERVKVRSALFTSVREYLKSKSN